MALHVITVIYGIILGVPMLLKKIYRVKMLSGSVPSVQSPSSLDDNGCSISNDHETFLKIIDVQQEDIKVLSKNYEDLRKSMAEKENRHHEQIYVSRPTVLQLSNRPELPLGNQKEPSLPNTSTLRYED